MLAASRLSEGETEGRSPAQLLWTALARPRRLPITLTRRG